MQQRAENGGFPTANEDGFDHGTPVLVVNLRDFIGWIKKVNNAVVYSGATVSPGNHFQSKERPEWVEVHGGRANQSYHFLWEIQEHTNNILRRLDHFVFPVEPGEGEKNATPTR